MGSPQFRQNDIKFVVINSSTTCIKCRIKGIYKKESLHTQHSWVCRRTYVNRPIPVAARSKAWVCGRALAGIVGSNPTGEAWFLSCTVFVLSGRGLCDGPIPRPEESYRLRCVSDCDQVKINNLDTCCEQVGRRGKDCETNLPKLQASHSAKYVARLSNVWC
jgi:hypothetical protein